METIDLIFALLLAWFIAWCLFKGWEQGSKK
jgi:hypothetical protein